MTRLEFLSRLWSDQFHSGILGIGPGLLVLIVDQYHKAASGWVREIPNDGDLLFIGLLHAVGLELIGTSHYNRKIRMVGSAWAGGQRREQILEFRGMG